MGTPGTPPDKNGSDIDLGFGKFVSSKSRNRLLNRDGGFRDGTFKDVLPAPLGGNAGENA